MVAPKRVRSSVEGERAPRAPPPWSAAAGAALARAASSARMIAATKPQNLRAELERLEVLWRRGDAEAPRFLYSAPINVDELRAGLARMADGLEREGELGALYAGRARELAVEAEVCAGAGGPALWRAARRRYSRRDAFDDEADRAAEAWLEGSPAGASDDGAAGELVVSDDERDPRSLVARTREEVSKRKFALRVIVLRDLAPLAATGEGVIQIAAGRRLSLRDVERTVLHEIEGHAAPSERARSSALSIFPVGTANGSDDQEGRALALERAAGFLDRGRQRELGLRHKAARSVEAGASFVDTARMLIEQRAPLADALRIAARAHRGGGLGREAVYIPALLRVEAALRADESLDRVLGRGRVSVAAAPILRSWV